MTSPAAGQVSGLRGWVWLTVTVVLEVVGTLALKASDGFSVLGPSVMVVATYAGALVALSKALQVLPTSVAYVVWTAAGTAGVAVIGGRLFDEQLGLLGWLGLLLVIGGVALIRSVNADQPNRAGSGGTGSGRPARRRG